jgi:hypothetical protein
MVLSDGLNNINMLNFTLNSGYDCIMCSSPPEEKIEHLIFHCQFSHECWSSLNLALQQSGDRCQIVEQGRTQWTRPMFMEVFIVDAWNIWKERNNLLFNNITPELDS